MSFLEKPPCWFPKTSACLLQIQLKIFSSGSSNASIFSQKEAQSCTKQSVFWKFLEAFGKLIKWSLTPCNIFGKRFYPSCLSGSFLDFLNCRYYVIYCLIGLFCITLVWNGLTLFMPTSHFYTPWKQKITGFVAFSRGIEMGHWREKG